MPITDPQAVNFSDQQIRPQSDRLAGAYIDCELVEERWRALGGDQAALDIMEEQIRFAADRLYATYAACELIESAWFNQGQPIPNTSEVLVDGAPADGRPQVTGEDCVRIVDLLREMRNWLLSATGDWGDFSRSSVAYLNTVVSGSSYGPPPPMTLATAQNAINRFAELVARYDDSNQLRLGWIEAVAPNPFGGPSLVTRTAPRMADAEQVTAAQRRRPLRRLRG